MSPRHLGQEVSALVDGELGHDARDRALAHVATCAACRDLLDAERRVKDRLAHAPGPVPASDLDARLRALAEPGDPVPPRSRRMPLAPVVPTLPPPGSTRRPGGRGDGRRPAGSRPRVRRARYTAVTAVSAVGLVLGAAFAAGGTTEPPGTPVLPPAAELTVEHAATTSGMPLHDPAFDAVTATFGGLTFPEAPGR
jgi:hypothetical protein